MELVPPGGRRRVSDEDVGVVRGGCGDGAECE